MSPFTVSHVSRCCRTAAAPCFKRRLGSGGTTDDGEMRSAPNRSAEAAWHCSSLRRVELRRNVDYGKLLGQRPAFRKNKESKRPGPSRYSFDAQPSPWSTSIRIATARRALQLAAVTEVLQRELWRSADCSSWPPIDCKRRSARIVQRVLCVEQPLTARPNQLRQRRDPVLLTSEWPEGKPAELWATC